MLNPAESTRVAKFANDSTYRIEKSADAKVRAAIDRIAEPPAFPQPDEPHSIQRLSGAPIVRDDNRQLFPSAPGWNLADRFSFKDRRHSVKFPGTSQDMPHGQTKRS